MLFLLLEPRPRADSCTGNRGTAGRGRASSSRAAAELNGVCADAISCSPPADRCLGKRPGLLTPLLARRVIANKAEREGGQKQSRNNGESKRDHMHDRAGLHVRIGNCSLRGIRVQQSGRRLSSRAVSVPTSQL